MYCKFLLEPDFQEKLNSYNGNFNTIWKPIYNSGETHCYVELNEADFEGFLNHFMAEDASIVDENSQELPESAISFSANNGQRAFKFAAIQKK